MTPTQFKEKYQLSDADMAYIKMVCLMFNGKVVSVDNLLDKVY